MITVFTVVGECSDSDLSRCIESVQQQKKIKLTHYLINNGQKHQERVSALVSLAKNNQGGVLQHPIQVVTLPTVQTETPSRLHSLYGASVFLSESLLIAFLQPQDWFSESHLCQLYQALTTTEQCAWAYSGLKKHTKEGDVVGGCVSYADCQSDSLLDINIPFTCLFKRETLTSIASFFTRTDGALAGVLMSQFTNYVCTGCCSLNVYQQQIPTTVNVSTQISKKPELYILLGSAIATTHYLQLYHAGELADEFTYLSDMWQDYALLNAYTNTIPPGAKVFIVLQDTDTVPEQVLQRTDLTTICYAPKIPRQEHQMIWTKKYLDKFTFVLTYWTPLLANFNTFYCSPVLQDYTPIDPESVKIPTTRRVALFKESRDQAPVVFHSQLQNISSLSPKHKLYKEGLTHTCLLENLEKLQECTFALVIEECDAEGYVGQNIYDCYRAGVIPLYYGNNNSHVDLPVNTFIDIARFADGTEVQEFITSLQEATIEQYQHNISQHLNRILSEKSCTSFLSQIEYLLTSGDKVVYNRKTHGLGARDVVVRHLYNLFGYTSYLQVGKNNTHLFQTLDCQSKFCAEVLPTTQDVRYELIFLSQGVSSVTQLVRAMEILADTGCLVVWGTIPVSVADCVTYDLGVTWKCLVDALASESNWKVVSIDTDWGVTIIAREKDASVEISKLCQTPKIDFTWYRQHYREVLHPMTLQDFQGSFQRQTELVPSERHHRVHLITYADSDHRKTANRLLQEADRFGEFASTTIYGPTDLSTEFRNAHANALTNPKGSGLWVWKPHIIQTHLSLIKEGEFLLFVDAGCTIQTSGRSRFLQYLEMVSQSPDSYGCFGFCNNLYTEREYTKGDTFQYFKIETQSDIKKTGQIGTHILLLKKCGHTNTLVNCWNRVLEKAPEVFYGPISETELVTFKDHHYDQSVFSLILKKYGCVSVPDETVGELKKRTHVPILYTQLSDSNTPTCYL